MTTSSTTGFPTLPRIRARKAVAIGAGALDRLDPTWYTRVTPSLINLYSPYTCVLGQVFGDGVRPGYGKGLHALGLDESAQAEAAHGFLPVDGLPEWELKRAWAGEVNRRASERESERVKENA